LRTNRYAGELNLPNYQDDPDTVVVGSPGGSTYLSPEQAAAQPQTRDRGFEQLMAENPRNDDESLEAYTQRLAEADAKRRGQPRLRVPNPRAANRPGYPDRLQDFEDEFYYTNGYYPTF
jgi:hypothetical protein